MSSVLYYSNNCSKCQQLLQKIARNTLGKDCHFICIDKRISKNNNTYIIMENNQELLLPNAITRVPALLLLNNDYNIIFGDKIINYLKPEKKTYNEITSIDNKDPEAFSLNGLTDIVSDTYSFLDQNSDDLSAKGNGGLRQIHQYSTLEGIDKINTPEENYKPNTIGHQNIDIDKLRQQRNLELNQ